jgi:DNA-directed RNA polymerase specialized sigma24 family protein
VTIEAIRTPVGSPLPQKAEKEVSLSPEQVERLVLDLQPMIEETARWATSSGSGGLERDDVEQDLALLVVERAAVLVGQPRAYQRACLKNEARRLATQAADRWTSPLDVPHAEVDRAAEVLGLDGLGPRQAEVYGLVLAQPGLSRADLAVLIGVDPRAAEKALQRARASVRRRLGATADQDARARRLTDREVAS